MGKVYLLDCTLRDGGYINDWNFGEETIKGFSKKIAQTGIEFFEVGFIKGESYDPDKSLFPDTDSFTHVIKDKDPRLMYVGMLDMSKPVPYDCIRPRRDDSIDGIRIIFKKEKIPQAYEYCKHIQAMGYYLSVNIVGTDLYTDREFIDTIERFNTLMPDTVSIVDSFGLIKRKQFMRLVYLADNNLAEGITLAYHGHNNLQQAFGNAESLVEMNLRRDILIDACVFGMGRGAGNLNLELFAEFMNENYGTNYRIEPMLEIMDEYLSGIYRTMFWGYSLPLYLSASTHSHPNYAIYLAKKDTLSVKSFNELLKSIPEDDKARFSKEKAEKYYSAYQENYIDDREALEELSAAFAGKRIVLLAPGSSLSSHADEVREALSAPDTIGVAVNFTAEEFRPAYVFSGNMRRYGKIEGKTDAKCIISSNVKEAKQADYIVNYASFCAKDPEIADNSGLMLLRLLGALGVREVLIAGMDGYSGNASGAYYNRQLEYDFSKEAERRNALISEEIREIGKTLKLTFLTPTAYK